MGILARLGKSQATDRAGGDINRIDGINESGHTRSVGTNAPSYKNHDVVESAKYGGGGSSSPSRHNSKKYGF